MYGQFLRGVFDSLYNSNNNNNHSKLNKNIGKELDYLDQFIFLHWQKETMPQYLLVEVSKHLCRSTTGSPDQSWRPPTPLRDQNQTTDVCDNYTCDLEPTSIGTLCYLVKEIRIYWKTNPAQLQSLVERIPNTGGKRCPGDEPACQVSRRWRHFEPGWRSMMGQYWKWYEPS